MEGKLNAKRIRLLILTALIAIGMCVPAITQPASAASKKPAKVKGVKVTCTSATAVKVTWKKAKKAKKYQVQYRKGEKGKWKKKNTKKKSLKIKKLKKNALYQFRVRGIKGKKKGKWSQIVKVKINPKKPGPIRNLYVYSISYNKTDQSVVKIDWAAGKYAADYKVSCKDKATGKTAGKIKVDVKNTKATITGLTPTKAGKIKTYTMSVQAINGTKKSAVKNLTTSTLETDNWFKDANGIYTNTDFQMNYFTMGVDEGVLPVFWEDETEYINEGYYSYKVTVKDEFRDEGYSIHYYMDDGNTTDMKVYAVLDNGFGAPGTTAKPDYYEAQITQEGGVVKDVKWKIVGGEVVEL